MSSGAWYTSCVYLLECANDNTVLKTPVLVRATLGVVNTWVPLPLAFHSEREADHSPPSSAEVKEWVELYLHSPNTPSWGGDLLGGAQGQLYLCLYLYLLNVMYHSRKRFDFQHSGLGYGDCESNSVKTSGN
jgi:hypothetical protein